MYSIPYENKPKKPKYNTKNSKWYEHLYNLGKVKLKARELIKRSK